MNTTTQGKLIVIEGGDAAGKATQVALLTSTLLGEGELVAQFDFPRYQDNHIGKLLRECLDGERGDFMALDGRIASVLYAVDRKESEAYINKWLNEGTTVLLDRYSSASILHQGAKEPDAAQRLETMRWIYELEHTVLGLPLPDAIFTLPVPAFVRAELRQKQSRTKGRMIDLADQDQVHQQLVDQTLHELSNVYEHVTPITTMQGDNLRRPEDIAADILDLTRTVMAK